ncbi:MAG: GNAT family N-acetyltransferase [Nostoc sp.]|uniref:GNAT family N-acetyltransferase n=1 Tax=Nostoc sp. TaxID=1180 RepID=UPI002FFABDA0
MPCLTSTSTLKVCVGILLPSSYPNEIVTDDGHYFHRHQVIDEIVKLHLYLGHKLGENLNPMAVREGVETMIENSSLGQYVLAWTENDQVIGQLEIKKTFEAWYNSAYWYLDNYVVFPEFQKKGVGTILLNYVKKLADMEGIGCLRLYVANHNIDAEAFYTHRGFYAKGHMMEYQF